MSKGIVLSFLASALLGCLCILPLWLYDFSAVEIVFGRFLVFGLLILLILPFRLDVLKHYSTNCRPSCWCCGLMYAITGHIGYYLFLLLSIRSLGGMAAFLLTGILPVLFSLSLHRKNDHLATNQWLPLLMFFCSLVLLMFDKAAMIESSSDKEQLSTGVVWIALAGVCWLWAARLQVKAVRAYQGIDRSDNLIISGLCTCMVLCLLLPLILVGDGEWRLFSDMDDRNWLMFWSGVVFAGLFSTLLARVIWNNNVSYAHESVRIAGMITEPLFVAVLVFLYEARWPDTVEWTIITLSGVALWIFYRNGSWGNEQRRQTIG